jgi:hypothetical protein
MTLIEESKNTLKSIDVIAASEDDKINAVTSVISTIIQLNTITNKK